MQISAFMVPLMICPANQTAPQIRFLQTNVPNARLTIFYMSLYQIRFFQHTEGTRHQYCVTRFPKRLFPSTKIACCCSAAPDPSRKYKLFGCYGCKSKQAVMNLKPSEEACECVFLTVSMSKLRNPSKKIMRAGGGGGGGPP